MSATINVIGSIYAPSEPGIIYAQVLDEEGNPANDAVVSLTLFCGDGTIYEDIDEKPMSYAPFSNGIYKYPFIAPLGPERMIADIKSEDPIAYGAEDIYVAEWSEDISQLVAKVSFIL